MSHTAKALRLCVSSGAKDAPGGSGGHSSAMAAAREVGAAQRSGVAGVAARKGEGGRRGCWSGADAIRIACVRRLKRAAASASARLTV